MPFLKRVKYLSYTVHSNLVSQVLYFTLFNHALVFETENDDSMSSLYSRREDVV